MSPLIRAAERTFSSLRIRNFRLYFIGQIISMAGTWGQSVAQMWLVYELSGSEAALGLVTALQFSPVLVAGMWGGVIADRFDKRKVLVVAQSIYAGLALTLGLVTATGVVELWMVFALAFGLGCVSSFEVPTRQSFTVEMVGPDQLTNAVGLNSTIFTSARVMGPAIAGVLISTVGIAWCFLLNAASFLAVIAGLVLMDPDDLMPAAPAGKAKGQLREALRYVWHTPVLRSTMGMIALIGTLAFNFRVLLPVMAKVEFGGGAGTYGALSAFMGGGTMIGALYVAGRRAPTRRFLIGAAFAYGVFILAAGAAPALGLEFAALVPMGAAGIAFVATANSTLQLNASDAMRGRVMALYSVVFLGTTPIGSPIVGWMADAVGARAGFVLSAVACLAACAWGLKVGPEGGRAPAPGTEIPAVASTPEDVEPGPSGGAPAYGRLRSAVRFALRR
ncbi:MAG: MFS transporter [Actinomycetota bacterium]